MVKRKETSSDADETANQKKAPRRMKGEGSLYQRTSDGRWVGSFRVEETGKLKYVYGKTKKEASDKLKRAQREQEQGILAIGTQQKLGDYLNWWLDEVHKHKVRTGTYIRYRGLLDNHILPELGQIQLRKLTMRQIQSFYNKKLDANQSCSSVHQMHSVLHSALKSAVKGRHISYNPADGIELPSNKPRRDGQSLTLEQARHLLKESRGHRLEVFIALALITGMRHGEILALRWDDINFEQETVYIHCTVSYRGRYKFIEGDPKTKSSRRTIPLFPVMRDILLSHRKQQNDARLNAGALWQEKNLVFCTRTGGFCIPVNTQRDFLKLLKRAGLPRVHIHDLRHTASTLWQSLGIDPKVRQEMLGHSSLEMTMTVYSHVLPSMQKEAIGKINGLFQDPS